MHKEVIIGCNTFKSQKSAETFIRNLINEIGICSSVKNKDIAKYSILYDLCLRHPDSNKLKNIYDFMICKNKLNASAYELNIINLDGSITDISWRVCITGKSKPYKTDLHSAFRICVDNQIKDFRKDNMLICALCNNSNTEYHIDHVIHFQKIVEDFLQNYKGKLPEIFDITNDSTNRCCFKIEDIGLSNQFQDYHKQNAELRVLCKECNLRRSKYKN